MVDWKKVDKVMQGAKQSFISWGLYAYSKSRIIGWWIVTTGMITALPLVFEVKRENMVEELEQLQINQGLAEGKSPNELAQMGLASAIEPKVL
jgi:hypothetical protein